MVIIPNALMSRMKSFEKKGLMWQAAVAFVATELCLSTGYTNYYAATNSLKPIAVTFDDGPDPRFTLAILEAFRHFNVHAAFSLSELFGSK